MKPTSICLALLAGAPCWACGDPTAGERIDVPLALRSDASNSSFALSSGWTVELDEARILIGPVFLRGPRRTTVAELWQWLVPRALAHGDHAQTLTEGQVMGEWLEQVAFDPLEEGQLELGLVDAEVGVLDRVSLLINPPASARAKAQMNDAHAFVRGTARKGDSAVRFHCGLRIAGDRDEMPENLEVRRRVDNISLQGERRLSQGSVVSVGVLLARWFEFVDFDALDPEGPDDRCADGLTRFAAQWYLGVRRPEAFSVDLTREEQTP